MCIYTYIYYMMRMFDYGEKAASSSRIESNFNNLKHGVYNNDTILIRGDHFVEKLVNF